MKNWIEKVKKAVEEYSNTATIEIVEPRTTGREVLRITDTRGIFLPHTLTKKCNISCYACGKEIIMLLYKC